jgi:hypothetical protein
MRAQRSSGFKPCLSRKRGGERKSGGGCWGARRVHALSTVLAVCNSSILQQRRAPVHVLVPSKVPTPPLVAQPLVADRGKTSGLNKIPKHQGQIQDPSPQPLLLGLQFLDSEAMAPGGSWNLRGTAAHRIHELDKPRNECALLTAHEHTCGWRILSSRGMLFTFAFALALADPQLDGGWVGVPRPRVAAQPNLRAPDSEGRQLRGGCIRETGKHGWRQVTGSKSNGRVGVGGKRPPRSAHTCACQSPATQAHTRQRSPGKWPHDVF